MEISANLKKLYKHWPKHVKFHPQKTDLEGLDRETLENIKKFINERMVIWQRKASGQTPPFTEDPILANYRFCNIYRELDRQTIEIHQILKPIEYNFSLWLLNVAFNRFLCNPETYQKVGQLTFNKDHNYQVMQNLLELNNPKYGSAYVFPISVIQRSEFPTREEFFCLYLPQVMESIANKIEKMKDESVVSSLEIILPRFGYNFRFHWAEILIDVAYQFPDKINLFRDFHIGPGSEPTMKILSSQLSSAQVLKKLTNLDLGNMNLLEYKGEVVPLSAENWEGIGCEFRKYTNLKAGKGRKRKFN